MTLILCETYVGKGSRFRYFINRFLRLYPVYWFVTALTLAGLIYYPMQFQGFHSSIRLPTSDYEWFQNVTLFDLIYSPLRLVPPAWSLSVELLFYIFIGTGISVWISGAVCWWLVSVIYTLYLIVYDASFGERYTAPFAASLFFSSGAVIYHVNRFFPAQSNELRWSWAVLLGCFCVFPLACEFLGLDPHKLGYYGSLVLFTPLLIKTIRTRPTKKQSLCDNFLGNLAYPIFLSHYLAACLVDVVTNNCFEHGNLFHLISSLIICLVISVFIIKFIDPLIDKARYQIRPRNKTKQI